MVKHLASCHDSLSLWRATFAMDCDVAQKKVRCSSTEQIPPYRGADKTSWRWPWNSMACSACALCDLQWRVACRAHDRSNCVGGSKVHVCDQLIARCREPGLNRKHMRRVAPQTIRLLCSGGRGDCCRDPLGSLTALTVIVSVVWGKVG